MWDKLSGGICRRTERWQLEQKQRPQPCGHRAASRTRCPYHVIILTHEFVRLVGDIMHGFRICSGRTESEIGWWDLRIKEVAFMVPFMQFLLKKFLGFAIYNVNIYEKMQAPRRHYCCFLFSSPYI